MKKTILFLLSLAALSVAFSAPAAAGDIRWSIGVGSPYGYGPSLVIGNERRVYVAPPVVYPSYPVYPAYPAYAPYPVPRWDAADSHAERIIEERQHRRFLRRQQRMIDRQERQLDRHEREHHQYRY